MAIRFLRHALSVGLLAAGALLCMVISVQAASAGLPDYLWDLRKRMPVHHQAYLKILPSRLKRTAWLGRFDGTGMPVERVTVNTKVYFGGGVCKPHACAANYLTFLIEANGSRAVAMEGEGDKWPDRGVRESDDGGAAVHGEGVSGLDRGWRHKDA